MDYNELNQITSLLKNLDQKFSELKPGNDIEDPLPYMEEDKKIIKFVNHDLKIFNIKVPISINIIDLYSIANYYKSFECSNFILVYKNRILKEDESSISCIFNEDIVTIIEDIYYIDDSYLKSLLISPPNEPIINIKCSENGTIKATYPISKETKVSELYKALILNYGNSYEFFYNSEPLSNLKMFKQSQTVVIIKLCQRSRKVDGIKILGKSFVIKLNNKKKDYIIKVGTLSSTKKFVEYLYTILGKEKIIKRCTLDKKEISLNEDKTFVSLGIKYDCDCFVEY